jgi:hypothetical protein
MDMTYISYIGSQNNDFKLDQRITIPELERTLNGYRTPPSVRESADQGNRREGGNGTEN